MLETPPAKLEICPLEASGLCAYVLRDWGGWHCVINTSELSEQQVP